MLLVTHDVDEALALAERVVLLDHGRITVEIPILQGEVSGASVTQLRERLLDYLGVPASARGSRPTPPTTENKTREHSDSAA